MNKTHECPICRAAVAHQERYPLQVCDECAGRVRASDRRRITYGFPRGGRSMAYFNDYGTPYLEEFCWIDGVRCRAEEDRFGRGTVIQAAPEAGDSQAD